MTQFSKIVDVSVPLKRFLDLFWGKRPDPVSLDNGLIIVNTSARGNHKKFRLYLLNRFIKIYNLDVKYVSSHRDFDKLNVKKYTSIFIASGDGFFNAALNDSRFHTKSLGFFPLGAGNALYPYIYGMLPFLSLRLKKKFYEKEIDVVEISAKGLNVQTLFASIGFDAEFIKFDNNRSTSAKKDFMNCAKNALLHKMPVSDITYKVNGATNTEKNIFTAAFGKMPYYGYRIKSMPFKIEAADSNVYLCAYKGTPLHNMNKLLRIAHITPIPYVKNPVIKKIVGPKIDISSTKEMPLQYAGEFAGYFKKFSVKVVRKQKLLIS